MANEAINGFDNEVTILSDNSRFGLDYWNGSGFVTSQIKYENIEAQILGDIPIRVSDLELALPFKYDASNPNGYETPAQLNVRDTANRQRANHTGTQLASTISDFASASDLLDKDSLNMYMGSAPAATITSTTYYFSAAPGLTLRSSPSGLAVRPTRNGKIIGASFTRFISSTLGNRSYSLYVRINDTTDYLVATVATTAVESFFSNSALNSVGISVTTSDSIVMKLVVSGGTTDSTNVLFFGNLFMIR